MVYSVCYLKLILTYLICTALYNKSVMGTANSLPRDPEIINYGADFLHLNLTFKKLPALATKFYFQVQPKDTIVNKVCVNETLPTIVCTLHINKSTSGYLYINFESSNNELCCKYLLFSLYYIKRHTYREPKDIYRELKIDMKKECIESIQTDPLVIKEITKKDSEKGGIWNGKQVNQVVSDSQKSQKISEPTVIYNERKFSHECTRKFEGNQDSLNMYHRLNYGSKTDLILLQVLPHYSLKVNIGLYHFDNNTKFICSETLKASGNKNESNTEEVKTIFVNFTKINAENDSDKEYIQYYENMTYDITCKGIHSRWLLLNKDNMVLQIREELRINLNFNFNSNYSRLICIEYECKNFRDINTTVCTRRVRRDLNFLSYKYQSNDNNCNPGSGSIIAYIVLVGIILILLYFVLCRKFKKPRPPMPLPAEGTDSNHILYSVAYDHVVRRR